MALVGVASDLVLGIVSLMLDSWSSLLFIAKLLSGTPLKKLWSASLGKTFGKTPKITRTEESVQKLERASKKSSAQSLNHHRV